MFKDVRARTVIEENGIIRNERNTGVSNKKVSIVKCCKRELDLAKRIRRRY